MSPSLQARLERMSPLRIILRKGVDDNWEGLIEHSFSMGWSDHRVLIYWSGKTYSMLGEHRIDAEEDCAHSLGYYPLGAQAFDPLSPECPVAVDIASWLETLE